MKKVKQRPQFIWGSLIGSIGNIASSVINNNARNKLVKEQMAEQARQNAINNNQLAVNNLNNYYASQNNLDNAYKSAFEDQIVYRCGGKARPKASWGMLATLGSLAGTAIDGFASQGFGYNKLQGGNYANNVNTNPNIKYSVNPASTGMNLIYRRGGTATQHPRRRMFAKGGKYNFTNFANRLERNVNESDNTRVAGGRRVVNARNRQYRQDNSLIGKVINYIDKSDRASQIKRKGTLTAQQYRNNKSAQTFGRYDRVNYNGKTYYVPQVQGGIAPTVGISNAGKVASFYDRLGKAKRVFSGTPSVSNLRRKPNLPSLETIITGGRNNFKGISNTERTFRPNPVMPKGYRVTGLKGTQSSKEIGKSLYNYLTRRTAIVPDRGNVKPFGITSNSTYSAIRPKLYNTRISPMHRTDNNPAYEGRIPFMSVGDRIRVGADKVNVAVKPVVQKLNNLNNKRIEWNNTLRAYSKEHPYATQAIVSALETSALLSAYDAAKNYIQSNNTSNNSNKNIAASKPVNKPKAKVQPQQVKNDTVQVANQTPNDSTVVQNNTQNDTTKVVNNQAPVTNNRSTNQAANSTQTSTNNQRVITNNKTKVSAQTVQRKGRTKSMVYANRTNNIRQNLNFEPVDDTVNGYSQVEDIQGGSYDEYQADIDAEAEARRQEVINDLLNNYHYEDRNTTDEMRYGGKARSKIRVPIKITDGGVAQRIGNNTFLLRGSSHEQVNPSGQTGIGIKVGNNEIEAEGGEVAQRVGNALRIFSAQPMINGVSPAQAVELGANKNRIFAIQEALKRRGYKCGGRAKFEGGGMTRAQRRVANKLSFNPNDFGTPESLYPNMDFSTPKGWENVDLSSTGKTSSNTTPINNWWNRNGMSVNSSDWIGLGTDLAGSLALGAFNSNAYKNLKYDYQLPNYVDETPVAFDTTYHNDAQRATVERNRLNAQKIIANNTSSASTALQRMQQSNADAMMETNKLWDEKANKETELRNAAAQNEQQVRARNAAARNQYYQNVAEIQNKRIDAENANRLARSNAWSTSLQGIQGAANNFLNNTRQRYEDENALMSTIAAGDAATPYRMMAFGTQFGPRIINAIRAMNNIEGMKDPGAAPIRSNYSNDADYSTARSKWEAAMKNYEYWKQRNQFLSNYDNRGRLIRRR